MTQEDEFLKHLLSLAPEGETMLLLRQVPRKDANGDVELHPNGAVKSTFPAFLPETVPPKRVGAWYGNTASFRRDRMAARRVSASRANCDYVLVMMLDDIGTKSKVPPLPPTWRMETSPGNQQWGYVFREQPSKGEFAAAIVAIATAGYTDPGAVNPVRNFRLPGSVNLKPELNGFQARLLEFDREREYTLSEICDALGVVPGAAVSDGPQPIRVDDDGGDDVMRWLNEQGYVYSPPNAEGWMGVQCPNAHQHTDGSPEGRYMPATRAYCCLHSHCVDLTSETFLAWVAEQGGPHRSTGLREELVQARLAAALPAPDSPAAQAAVAQTQAIIEAVERKEAGRVEMAGWFERFAYLFADDGYFDLVARKQYSRANFNATFRHIRCNSVHANAEGKARRVEASIAFDENRQAMGARVLQGVTYAAGEGVLVARDGDVYANLWRDARPDGVPGDVTPWLRHMERMIPDEAEREHVLSWMAHKVQYPGIKINHGILHAGHPGSGKDTLWDPFLHAVGGASRANIALVRNEELNSQWGYPLMSEVLVINELRQTDMADRRALENRLKPLLAAPPELIPVNRKNQHPFDALNRLAVVAFSNERLAITLPSDDRRWYVLWSEAHRMSPESARTLWSWYDTGGRDAVAAWLHARDVSAWNPAATPPTTDAKLTMMSAGLSTAESAIVEMMRDRRGEFTHGAVMAPWAPLCDRLAGLMPPGVRVSPVTLLHAAREAGWLDLGMIKAPEFQTKRHILCAPDALESAGNSRAEVRRRCEAVRAAVSPPRLRVAE